LVPRSWECNTATTHIPKRKHGCRRRVLQLAMQASEVSDERRITSEEGVTSKSKTWYAKGAVRGKAWGKVRRRANKKRGVSRDNETSRGDTVGE